MLNALWFAFSLEGLLPGTVLPRRPVAQVRFERRRNRGRLELVALADRLAAGAETPVAMDATVDLVAGTRSVGGTTGGRTVLMLR